MAAWVISFGTRCDLPFPGAAAVIAVRSAVLFGSLAAASADPLPAGYNLDAYKMARDCVAGRPVYETGDGLL